MFVGMTIRVRASELRPIAVETNAQCDREFEHRRGTCGGNFRLTADFLAMSGIAGRARTKIEDSLLRELAPVNHRVRRIGSGSPYLPKLTAKSLGSERIWRSLCGKEISMFSSANLL